MDKSTEGITPESSSNEAMTIQVQGDVTGPTAPQASTDEGGKKYAGEFDSVEDLEAKYAELKAQQKADTSTPPEGGDGGESVNAFLDTLGLDSKALTAEYELTGKLSDESYNALAAKGITKATVDQYLKGAEAINSESAKNTEMAEAKIAELQGTVGGPEEYQNMIKWAAENAPKEAIEAFNEVMNSGTDYAIKLAIADMHKQYREADPQAPNLTKGKVTSGGSTNVFRSTAEVVAAMQDPRYGNDKAYTREVEIRVANSNVF